MPDLLINGQPGSQAGGHVPVDDRGLNYGDGVFETMALIDGRIRLLDYHLERLTEGCQTLAIAPPDLQQLRREIDAVAKNRHKAVIKVIVTRGSGKRGYRVTVGADPTRIVSVNDWPEYSDSLTTDGANVRICQTRLVSNPRLAGIKHLNRLEQVLARMEWDDDDISEGLMRDQAGFVVCGTMSNVFVVNQETLVTPSLDQCGVAGVMRRNILNLAKKLSIRSKIGQLSLDDLASCDELLLSNSIIGIWPVKSIEDRSLRPGPITRSLQDSFNKSGGLDCAG